MKFGIVVLIFIGLLVLCFAFLFKTGDTAVNSGGKSFFSEQQKMMREALDMAKEAQDMQRRHMREMERAMMEAEYGYADEQFDRAAATGSSPSDFDR